MIRIKSTGATTSNIPVYLNANVITTNHAVIKRFFYNIEWKLCCYKTSLLYHFWLSQIISFIISVSTVANITLGKQHYRASV